MKKFILIMMVILFSSISIAIAGECIYEDNDNTITLQYEYFATLKEAKTFAKKYNIEDNIIHDQDGGYYVFNCLPNEIFYCRFYKS